MILPLETTSPLKVASEKYKSKAIPGDICDWKSRKKRGWGGKKPEQVTAKLSYWGKC